VTRRTITPAQREKYFRLRQQGWTQQAAAGKAGFSLDTAKRWEREKKDIKRAQDSLERQLGVGLTDEGLPKPIPHNKLKTEARRALDDPVFFARRYFGIPLMPWQRDAAAQMVEALDTPYEEYMVINCPPGCGKSTFFTLIVPAWLTCRDRTIRGLIGSASQGMAERYVMRLRTALSRPTPVKAKPREVRMGIAFDAEATLAADYGVFRPENRSERWANDAFSVAQHDDVAVSEKENTWSAFGRTSTFLGSRVDFCIWDDVYDRGQMRTDEAREQLREWWTDTAESRVEPGGLLVLQGQRMHPEDIYRYAIDMPADDSADGDPDAPRKYRHVIYQAHDEQKCAGDHGPGAKPQPDGCLLFPARLPYKRLMAVKGTSPRTYDVVYQQLDTAPSSALVPMLWISGGRSGGEEFPGCWDDNRACGAVPDGVQGLSVISVDPSPSQFWAVQWWLLNPETNLRYLLDLHRQRMTAPDLLTHNPDSGAYSGILEEWWLRSKVAGRPVRHVIVEDNAAQRFLLQYEWAKRWAAARSVTWVPHQTYRNKADPNLGVQSIAPHYRYGRVRLPGLSRHTLAPMIKELTTWPEASTDDCVMAHWFVEFRAPGLHAARNQKPVRRTRPSWASRLTPI
jgi:hypothetical protein